MQISKDETGRLQAAENRAAVFKRERDAALAECGVLRRQLGTMQKDLDSARQILKHHQGCVGQAPGQGDEGQPSGDVRLGSGAEEQETGKTAHVSTH